MSARPPGDDDTPLPGSVMPMAEEAKLVRKPVKAGNDNASLRKQQAMSGAHYTDDDDHDHTIPI
jgi:hypothetical protein